MCCQSYNLTILKRLTSTNEPATCFGAKRRCGDVAQKSNLRSLREKHRAHATAQGKAPLIGDVVMVQAEEKNRGKWPLGIARNHIVGTDGIVRGAIVRSGRSCIERAVQHLYPLELSRDRQRSHRADLNPQAQPFRPRRDVALAARLRVQNIAI